MFYKPIFNIKYDAKKEIVIKKTNYNELSIQQVNCMFLKTESMLNVGRKIEKFIQSFQHLLGKDIEKIIFFVSIVLEW